METKHDNNLSNKENNKNKKSVSFQTNQKKKEESIGMEPNNKINSTANNTRST